MSSGAQPVRLGPRTLRSAALTRTQELIWASQRLHPDVPLANMGKRTRISGPLDPDRLVQAFAAVVRASEVLRMVVDAGAQGDERVRILDRPPRPTEVVDLPVTDLDAWSQDRIAQPIDATECVYDSVILRHADDDWTWWLDLHHVATDAAGSALVYAATSAAYRQLAAGDAVDLADVLVGEFFDVAEALAREPGGRDTPAERADEWRTDREAAGPQPPIELYGPVGPRTTLVDRVPVALDDTRRRRLDEAISGPYRSISRELGLLGLGVMAAAIAVHRLDGRSTVVIGVPVHHRSSKRTRRVVGPLMELYPLTVTVDTSERPADMFHRVLRSVTTLLRRAKPGESPDTPFEVVVNVLTARYGDFAGMPAASEWMRSGHVDPTHQLRLQLYDYDGADGQVSLQWELDVNRSASVDGAASRLPRHIGPDHRRDHRPSGRTDRKPTGGRRRGGGRTDGTLAAARTGHADHDRAPCRAGATAGGPGRHRGRAPRYHHHGCCVRSTRRPGGDVVGQVRAHTWAGGGSPDAPQHRCPRRDPRRAAGGRRVRDVGAGRPGGPP